MPIQKGIGLSHVVVIIAAQRAIGNKQDVVMFGYQVAGEGNSSVHFTI